LVAGMRDPGADPSQSQGNIHVQGRDVTIAAAIDSSWTDQRMTGKNHVLRHTGQDEALAGGTLAAAGNLSVLATGTPAAPASAPAHSLSGDPAPPLAAEGGSITVTGARLAAGTGSVALVANQDITVEAATTHHAQGRDYAHRGGTLLRRDSQSQSSQAEATVAHASTLSGHQVILSAGDAARQTGDITIAGSHVVADQDV